MPVPKSNRASSNRSKITMWCLAKARSLRKGLKDKFRVKEGLKKDNILNRTLIMMILASSVITTSILYKQSQVVLLHQGYMIK